MGGGYLLPFISAARRLLVAVFCITPIIFNSCADLVNLSPESLEIENVMSVDEAKAVFELAVTESNANYEQNPTKAFLPTMALGNIVPKWKTTKTSVNQSGTLESIEVEVSSSYCYRAYQIIDVIQDTCVIYCPHKLLVVKDKTTGESGCYVEFYLKSNEYAKTHKYDQIDMYRNCGSLGDFSGLKLYTDLAGIMVRVDRYENGKKIAGVNVAQAEDVEDYKTRILCAVSIMGKITFQRGSRICTKGGESGGWKECRIGDYEYRVDENGNWEYREPGSEEWNKTEMLDSIICSAYRSTPNTDPTPDPTSDRGGYNSDGGGGQVGNRPKNTSKSITFSSSFKYNGYVNRNCLGVAKDVVRQLGCKIVDDGGANAMYVKKEDVDVNGKHILRDLTMADRKGMVQHIKSSSDCANTMVNLIDNDCPVVVGVDHTGGRTDNEGTTDHFVVVYAYFYENNVLCFRYIETGRKSDNWKAAKADYNILRFDGESITGNHYDAAGKIKKQSPKYTVTQYRRTIKQ